MKNNMLLIIIISVIVTAVSIAAIFSLPNTFLGNNPKINIPEEINDFQGENGNIVFNKVEDIKNLDITKENVISVILSLNRPSTYYFELKSTVFANEQSFTQYNRVWTKNEFSKHSCHFEYDDGTLSQIQNLVITNKFIYSWAENSINYTQTARGDFTADDFVLFPTYESLAAYTEDDIIDFEISERNGSFYLQITVLDSKTQNTTTYYIDIKNGLLTEAVSFYKNKLVYSANATYYSINSFDNSIFMLPDDSLPIV